MRSLCTQYNLVKSKKEKLKSDYEMADKQGKIVTKSFYDSYMTMSLAELECSFSSSLSLICRLV